VISKLV